MGMAWVGVMMRRRRLIEEKTLIYCCPLMVIWHYDDAAEKRVKVREKYEDGEKMNMKGRYTALSVVL